jgi:hypothetical protein
MQTVTVEFGAWEPDAALLNGQQAPEARNVIPAQRGYRSMPGMDKGRYAALSDPVLEMFSTKQMDGTILTYAATSDDIYALEGGAWT